MSNDLATISYAGKVATLTLQRPDARNALSLDLLRTLHTCVDELATKTESHVCVITGSGKSFCAGMDLRAVLDDDRAAHTLLHSLAELTLKIRALPMVTLAKVQGAAIGGGCGLACVCDIALTHADSKMGYPEVDLGVCPAVVAPWLVRKIGAGRARKVLLSGGLMSGQQAFDIGMVDILAPTLAELDTLADTTIQRLSQGGPRALRATKDLLNRIDGSNDADIVKRGADLSAKIVGMPETRAVLRAKLERK